MRLPRSCLASLTLLALGCGGSTESAPAGAGGAAATSSTTSTSASTGGQGGGGATSSTTSAGSGGAGGVWDISAGCKAEAPPGALHAKAPKPYSGGTCPTLPKVTTQDIALTSSGNDRKFWLVVPSDLADDEVLPVLFLWHWLKSDAQSFFDEGDVQNAVDQQRFIAVIPQAKGDLQFTWPYSAIDSGARLEEEAVFFDDMLSCVSEQFHVEADCVGSAGVSAGALFTDQLVGIRSEYLASFLSLSGGTGGAFIKPWTTPNRPLPGLVLWGGPSDDCVVIDFEKTSADLEQHLVSEGSFFVECVHNCGHAAPPLEPPPGVSAFAGLWQFVLDHPYWLGAGQSPYLTSGLPESLPTWCGIGPASAVPRTGDCPSSPACN